MEASLEVRHHQRRVQTVERVREFEQACAKAVRHLEANGVAPGPSGWLLDAPTGMTLGRDAVLRCWTKDAGLQPLCFDLIAGEWDILDGAEDDRHLKLDSYEAYAVLVAGGDPVRLVFFDNTRRDKDRHQHTYLMPWFFERVLELAGGATTDLSTAGR